MIGAAGKACPLCGHFNKQTAKNCTQCGTAFFLAEVEGETRKRCASCGHYNRMNAKACTRCGTRYTKVQIAGRGRPAKWCPRCGAQRKPSAKVCPRCGYRFVVQPSEAPVVQSNTSVEPKQVIEPPSINGEPAPYISPEELRELRLGDRARTDFLIRVMQKILGDKKS
jgi:uncharacterized OB-fold protein